MHRIIVVALIVSLPLMGLLVGCEENGSSVDDSRIEGSGNPTTREFDFSDFNRIDAGPAFQLEIHRSDSYSVSVTVDDNLINYVDVSKRGDTLHIGLKPGQHQYTILEAAVTMPDLYSLRLTAASSCTIDDFNFSHDFAVYLSAASQITGDITTGDAEFDLSAASRVDLQGSAGDIVIDASGASVVDLAYFPVNDAEVELSGASRATINLDGTLDADITGASTLEYIGEPTLGDFYTSGGSTVKKR